MRRTTRKRGLRTAAAITLACALTATAQAAHADPDPAPKTLTEVREELDSLYHDAEAATDKYNAADERATEQEKTVGTLNNRVEQTEAKVRRLRSRVGAAAAAQYRGGGLPAEAQFVLAGDPEGALDAASLARQAQQGTQGLLTALTATQKELRTRAKEASAELDRLRKSRQAMDTAREKIEQRIAAARKLEKELAAKELKRLAELEKKAAADAQAEWVGSGILKEVGTKASAQGREAIKYATEQLGKPYVWGAEGPDSYDCSGLTSEAWAAAGVPIPRTSETQWQGLQHIEIAQMRPGDLIIYFDDASHVAIYIGGGKMIHAPRPGRTVTVAPAASMEILGVVRPDA